MSGIFFSEDPIPGAPTARAEARPEGFAEEIAAGFEAHRRVTNFNKVDVLTHEETRKRLDSVEKATGVRPPDPFTDEFDEVDEQAIFDRWLRVDARAGATLARQEITRAKRDALEARIDALRAKNPDKDFDGGREAFDAQVKARARELEERLGEIGFIPNVVSGVAASFTDPTNIASSLVGGGGKTLLGAALREAAVNAGVEAILTPLDQQQRKALGLETSAGQVAGNIAGAAAFGAAFGAGGKGIEWAWGKLSKRQAVDIVDALPDEIKTPEIRALRNEIEQDSVIDDVLAAYADIDIEALHREAVAEIERELGLGRPAPAIAEPAIAAAAAPSSPPSSRRVMIDGVESEAYDAAHAELLSLGVARSEGRVTEPEAATAAERLLPFFRGLVVDENDKLIETQEGLIRFADDWLANIRDGIEGDADAASPMLESVEAHVEYLERVDRHLEAGAPTIASPPVVAPTPEAEFRAFAPEEILVDARRMQFKSGGDAEGVTDALKGVKKWDPLKAGTIIVWQDAEGRNFVADGHQRVGLARRLAAEGQSVTLYGHVLRAADGVGAEDARAFAAGVNIARGTGTAVDAAKVLKARPDLLDGALNPRAAFVRQAQGLMRLGDDAFGMVINEVIPEHYGALVGEIIPDPAEQVAVMGVLHRQNPANATEAEALIRQALAAGFDRSTQESLFGADIAAESMLGYRADVLARAVSQLRKDKRIFATLDREADEITDAGNVLNAEKNREIAQNAAEIAEAVLRTAHLSGPVSDALGRAARRLAAGGRPGPAVKAFIDELRALGPQTLRGLSGRGSGLRGAGGAGAAAGAGGPAAPAGPRLEGALDDFDEPRKGADLQKDALTDDLFGGPIEPSPKPGEEKAPGAPAEPSPPKLDPAEQFLTGLDEAGAPEMKTRRQLEKEFQADEDMIDRLNGCVKR